MAEALGTVLADVASAEYAEGAEAARVGVEAADVGDADDGGQAAAEAYANNRAVAVVVAIG